MKNLVIVESPTKAKTIGRFLGKDYQIKASMGHVIDLPKSQLGVDVDHEFTPQYQVIKDKKKIISELKQNAKEAENIILATDPDREGEAIAWHIKDVLGPSSKYKRIVFHEITKEAIEEAINNPRGIDENLVEAQTARRVLDRLVGYKLSPLLWKKVRRGLSAGRVQSVALRLIVEREREIEKFKTEKYYTIHAIFNKSDKAVEFELIEIDKTKIEFQETIELYVGAYSITKTKLDSEEKTKEVLAEIKKSNFKVSDIARKEISRYPNPPFTTSTLQQEAARRLNYSGKRTMTLAQKLYEEGFITYHRTDSVVMAKGAIFGIRNFVEKEYGKKYIPESPRFFQTKQKLAQEAHEAIRPTNFIKKEEDIKNELGREYAKLYDLIWRRAVASQMSDAKTESTTIFVNSIDKKYLFKANGSVLIFDGFLKINPQAIKENILPEFKAEENIDFDKIAEKEHDTQAPPRYNEASLIALLEEKGIGRPSTYATIISTISSRLYVEKEEGRFKPTPVGIAVNDFLVENFSTVDDVPFTAEMEEKLDSIAEGKVKWVPIISDFYKPFEEKLGKVEGAERVKIEVEETDEKCPKCGSPLVVRIGRFGKFLACSTFPNCKFTKQFVEETDFPCPKCKDGKVIVKKTRKGRRFYGCSNYPKCDFAVWKLEDLKK